MNNDELECEYCCTTEGVNWQVNQYNLMMYYDEEMHAMCDGCAQLAADEV